MLNLEHCTNKKTSEKSKDPINETKAMVLATQLFSFKIKPIGLSHLIKI